MSVHYFIFLDGRKKSELPDVKGTINDLTSPTLLSDREKDVREGSLDLTYCLGEEGQMKYASR
ncbi:hypothetical protein ACF0H5_003544 [Mactra antiquata]